jgi:hypothetical protein
VLRKEVCAVSHQPRVEPLGLIEQRIARIISREYVDGGAEEAATMSSSQKITRSVSQPSAARLRCMAALWTGERL